MTHSAWLGIKAFLAIIRATIVSLTLFLDAMFVRLTGYPVGPTESWGINKHSETNHPRPPTDSNWRGGTGDQTTGLIRKVRGTQQDKVGKKA